MTAKTRRTWAPEASGIVMLYSDNGSQYISDAFRRSMKILGIEHRFIAYNTPEQNGCIEAFHKTLKREYVWPRLSENPSWLPLYIIESTP